MVSLPKVEAEFQKLAELFKVTLADFGFRLSKLESHSLRFEGGEFVIDIELHYSLTQISICERSVGPSRQRLRCDLEAAADYFDLQHSAVIAASTVDDFVDGVKERLDLLVKCLHCGLTEHDEFLKIVRRDNELEIRKRINRDSNYKNVDHETAKSYYDAEVAFNQGRFGEVVRLLDGVSDNLSGLLKMRYEYALQQIALRSNGDRSEETVE